MSDLPTIDPFMARDTLESARDEWWAQAHGLRAVIVAHFRGEITDEELYQRARQVWKWPSFGAPDFDAAYPAERVGQPGEQPDG